METQKTITEWSRQQFGYQNTLALALRMNVEVAELLNVLGVLQQDTYNGFHSFEHFRCLGEHAADEVADVAVMLLQVAETLGVDMMERVNAKMEKNRKRSWERTADGSFQHVEGT